MNEKLWTCPKCKRKFEKKNQQHSCNIYPIENHFKNKEKGKELYDELIKKLKTKFKFYIESLPCCIHLVKTSTFAAVFPLKDKIRVTFSLKYKLKNLRIRKFFKISETNYHYQIEINDKKDIDQEILTWIKEAYQKC
jgi:hypothetical protein